MKPWGQFGLDQTPVAICEVRGTKVTEITWLDKASKTQQKMAKYIVSCEFADGSQTTMVQMGRDYTGPYAFERGQRYIFSLRRFEVEKDASQGSFLDARPQTDTTGQIPKGK